MVNMGYAPRLPPRLNATQFPSYRELSHVHEYLNTIKEIQVSARVFHGLYVQLYTSAGRYRPRYPNGTGPTNQRASVCKDRHHVVRLLGIDLVAAPSIRQRKVWSSKKDLRSLLPARLKTRAAVAEEAR